MSEVSEPVDPIDRAKHRAGKLIEALELIADEDWHVLSVMIIARRLVAELDVYALSKQE
jgi:hypothetical protein